MARTELEVCKHDLDKLEVDLKVQNDENKRLKSEQNSMTNGLEKGSKEIIEAKENEIQKLSERVKALESEVEMLKKDKATLEKKRDELEKNIKTAPVVNNDATDATSKRKFYVT